ncbi:MAG: flotillin-like protein FloA [Bacteroidota bacterium]
MEALFGGAALVVILGIALFAIILLYFVPMGLWISAVTAGVKVRISELIGMRLRKVPPSQIVTPLIAARKAGIDVSASMLETHYLAGGHVGQTVNALISADKANIMLPFQQATAIDLAGRDVFEAVQVSVNPKVIETPPISAIAKDGIQVRAIARVTVRANINQLVGGAGEETIIARVGEGIVSTIGSSDTHLMVLENPDNISKTVLSKGLDSGTAFEILSIDIADVDVGENIGAKLQTDQAEADLQVARARAEERRAAAVAQRACATTARGVASPSLRAERGGGGARARVYCNWIL